MKTAIVTGAARRIGAAVARHLHARGLRVVIHYRISADSAGVLADELNSARPDSALTVGTDLADPAAPETIVRAALDAFGRLDLLVNNASDFYPTPLPEATQAQWDALMAGNLRGPFFLSQAAAPALAEAGGAIVNIADVHAFSPLKFNSIYCQAKAGLVMQTRALALELAPQVRVNAVAPGTILWPEGEAARHGESRQEILAGIPLARRGDPDDIAGAVGFLGLDAPYVTGQVLAVDGGRSLREP